MILCTLLVPIPCNVCFPTATSRTPSYQLKPYRYSYGLGAFIQNCEYAISKLVAFKLEHYTGMDDTEWMMSVKDSYNPVYVSPMAGLAVRSS